MQQRRRELGKICFRLEGNAYGSGSAAVSLIQDLYTTRLIKLCPETHSEYPEILFFKPESAWLALQFKFTSISVSAAVVASFAFAAFSSSFFMVRYNPLYVIGLCPVLGLIPHAGCRAPYVYTHGSTPFTVQLIRLRSQL